MIRQDLIGQNAPASLEHSFRFGDFEANRQRYQLRCGNRAVKLERIPLELLFLLLEHSGKLVDRERIVARLWRDESFLDTERSINTAIRKLRKALEDDPRHPHFIETVVGKGYRFVAPLLAEDRISDLPGKIASDEAAAETNEIRLRAFSVEITNGMPVLTCEVVVSTIALGRLPLLELVLPNEMALPLRPEDRLLLKLVGVQVNLSPKATQTLRAFSVSVLESGLRTRMTDFSRLAEESCEARSLQLARAAGVEPPR